ncbi:MAG TPA: hypothetical protein VHU84_09835 [Lacipirellulaceae bacterium]|jgi:hypothetical protein|nr:hypothetical protein [Lacipirellulaceae bacterium]
MNDTTLHPRKTPIVASVVIVSLLVSLCLIVSLFKDSNSDIQNPLLRQFGLSLVLQPGSGSNEWNALQMEQKYTAIEQATGMSDLANTKLVSDGLDKYYNPFGPDYSLHRADDFYKVCISIASAHGIKYIEPSSDVAEHSEAV